MIGFAYFLIMICVGLIIFLAYGLIRAYKSIDKIASNDVKITKTLIHHEKRLKDLEIPRQY